MASAAAAADGKEERKAPPGVIIPPPEIRGTFLQRTDILTQRRNHRENSKLRRPQQQRL
jgi:hypothetical protein